MSLDCPKCDEELDFLDYILNRATSKVVWELYICHNEDCEAYGEIFHELPSGELAEGDPSGNY